MCLLLNLMGFNPRRNYSIQSKLPVFLGGFGMLIPHLVVGGGIGLAAASGNHTTLLEVGLIIFATGWIIVVGLMVLSVKSNAHRSRLEDETKVCGPSKVSSSHQRSPLIELASSCRHDCLAAHWCPPYLRHRNCIQVQECWWRKSSRPGHFWYFTRVFGHDYLLVCWACYS